MVNMTPYQILVLAMLALWLIPLMLVWARFDRFPHGRELLAVVVLSPLLLTEQVLSAFEISANWHFLVAVFFSLPLLLTSLLSLALNRLLLDTARDSARMILLPGGVAVLASIPFLFYSLDYKSGLLVEAPVGDPTQHWYLYSYMLLCQGGILWQAFVVEKRLGDYQLFLSDQVVDTHLYRFSATIKAFGGLITLAFCAAVIILLVAFNLLPLGSWLQIMQFCYYLMFIGLSLILMEKRRYAPSPLDYAVLSEPDYSEQQLHDALLRAGSTMLRYKAYKKIGLRLKEFAHAADVEPTLLAVATRTLLKRNFRAFVYHYRLEYAKKILMRSDVRVTDVARRLGFDSERFLSEIFVKYVHKMAQEEKSAAKQDSDDLF
jgi:AraC-like DNA-binding protein